MDLIKAWRPGLAAAVIAAGSLAWAAPAIASTEPDPLWYYNLLGFEALHESGLTGEGVTIAVLDSPLYPDNPTLQGADVRLQDSFCLDANGVPLPGVTDDFEAARHGTNVVSYLVGTGAGYDGQTGVKGVAPGATVLYFPKHIFAGLDPSECTFASGAVEPGGADEEESALAFRAAVDSGADIISVSTVGGANEMMRNAMADAVRRGIIVVAGLGNDDGQSIDGAPGTLNGVASVLGAQSNGELNIDRFDQPNTSDYVQVIGPGWEIAWQGEDADWTALTTSSGSSIATPIVAGTLALAMQKYPEATGNQILQSMIHNTGQEGGDATWDPTFGYGFVVPTTLLAADPTQYPNVNPLLSKLEEDEVWDSINESGGAYDEFGQPWREPFYAEIFPTGDPSTGEPTQDPGASGSGGAASSGLGTLALIGGIVLLALVAAIVLTVVLVHRKKSN
jgi:subtilisin family serine protease